MTNPELDEICSLLRRVGREEVASRFRRTSHSYKADGSVVTQADLAVQERLVRELHRRWPELSLLSEEMPSAEQARLLAEDGPNIWCLDPLDGTSNFAGGFPFFSLSLAKIHNGVVEQGVVYDPVRDECFSAQRDDGAWCNGEPMRLGPAAYQLGECLAVVDFKRLPAAQAQRLASQPPYRSQRSLGSVALEWCWLAAGRFQLYLHGGQKLWDYAAGRLILQEAGGTECLLDPGRPGCRSDLDLAPRGAVAAAGKNLFLSWKAWLEI